MWEKLAKFAKKLNFWGVPLDPPGYTLRQPGHVWEEVGQSRLLVLCYAHAYMSFLRCSIIWYLVDSFYGRRCMFDTFKNG